MCLLFLCTFYYYTVKNVLWSASGLILVSLAFVRVFVNLFKNSCFGSRINVQKQINSKIKGFFFPQNLKFVRLEVRKTHDLIINVVSNKRLQKCFCVKTHCGSISFFFFFIFLRCLAQLCSVCGSIGFPLLVACLFVSHVHHWGRSVSHWSGSGQLIIFLSTGMFSSFDIKHFNHNVFCLSRALQPMVPGASQLET